ncbi:hypothetical protein DH2020_036012 [Rehmannia glutinosa]|uniref:CMP/dCMP-type deaminase domain-containing protein n=1 Tax=Rehmannia glutinosa TaxID=99300 RepID=A0ABR0V4T8_REHGL
MNVRFGQLKNHLANSVQALRRPGLALQRPHSTMNWSVDEAAKDSSECWKIIHIPEKPPVLPHLQATGKNQLSVILCTGSGNDGEFNRMPEDVLELVNTYQLSTFTEKVVNAAVIVDPSTRQVIACSCDQVLSCDALTNSTSRESCCSKPPEATMQFDANKIEKDQIFLFKCSTNEAKQSYKNVSCLHPGGWLEQQSHLTYGSWHPLRHAAIVAIENSAARDRRLFPVKGKSSEYAEEDYECLLQQALPRKGKRSIQMCSMAIVHQRIKRVFYAFPNPNDGGLGSVHRLQGERSLNHHYAVFRVLLPEEFLKSEALPMPSKS